LSIGSPKRDAHAGDGTDHLAVAVLSALRPPRRNESWRQSIEAAMLSPRKSARHD